MNAFASLGAQKPPLYGFQEDAIDAISGSALPVYNAMEPGLGKTRVAIGVMRQRKFRRVLVTCPSSGVLVWTREIAKWWNFPPRVTVLRSDRDAPKLGYREGIFIAPYGVLSRPDRVDVIEALIAADTMDMSVLDEAHFLKNPNSNRATAIFASLRDKLGFAHPMSGTPAPNHAGELWGVLHAFRPDLIRSPIAPFQPMNEPEFMSRYCEIERFVVNERWVEQVTGSKNVGELRSRLGPFFLRETKARVLKELPPIVWDLLPVPASPAHAKVYDDFRKLVPGDLSDEQILAALASGGEENARVYAALGMAKADGVIQWVRDELEGNRRRMVVWAVHHQVIDTLKKNLLDLGVSKFDGRDNELARARAESDFMSGKNRIFLGQIVAAGTALTLVSEDARCSDVLFAESLFSPHDNAQAACRVHRIGQRDAVLARYACVAGTFDDRVQAILARKMRDFVDLFGG